MQNLMHQTSELPTYEIQVDIRKSSLPSPVWQRYDKFIVKQ